MTGILIVGQIVGYRENKQNGKYAVADIGVVTACTFGDERTRYTVEFPDGTDRYHREQLEAI